MKELYTKPELLVEEFEKVDVLTASQTTDGGAVTPDIDGGDD